MGSCYTCSKYLFIFLNVLFLICGIASIPVIIWLMLDPTIPLRFTQEPNDFMIAAGLYIVAAVILIIIAILGIYSVTKEVKWALVVSFSLLLIIVVVEVASGVWGYMNRDRLDLFIKNSVKMTVMETYDKDEDVKDIFDTVQSKMQCCGAEKATDWVHQQTITLGGKGMAALYNIPQSCCRQGIALAECVAATSDIKFGSEPNYLQVYDKGCYYLIMEKLTQFACIIMAVCGAVLAVQLLGLVLGLILTFSMNKSNRYKS